MSCAVSINSLPTTSANLFGKGHQPGFIAMTHFLDDHEIARITSLSKTVNQQVTDHVTKANPRSFEHLRNLFNFLIEAKSRTEDKFNSLEESAKYKPNLKLPTKEQYLKEAQLANGLFNHLVRHYFRFAKADLESARTPQDVSEAIKKHAAKSNSAYLSIYDGMREDILQIDHGNQWYSASITRRPLTRQYNQSRLIAGQAPKKIAMNVDLLESKGVVSPSAFLKMFDILKSKFTSSYYTLDNLFDDRISHFFKTFRNNVAASAIIERLYQAEWAWMRNWHNIPLKSEKDNIIEEMRDFLDRQPPEFFDSIQMDRSYLIYKIGDTFFSSEVMNYLCLTKITSLKLTENCNLIPNSLSKITTLVNLDLRNNPELRERGVPKSLLAKKDLKIKSDFPLTPYVFPRFLKLDAKGRTRAENGEGLRTFIKASIIALKIIFAAGIIFAEVFAPWFLVPSLAAHYGISPEAMLCLVALFASAPLSCLTVIFALKTKFLNWYFEEF